MLFLSLVLILFIHESRGEKFIINTDAGGDDAVAILMLLRHEAWQSKISGNQTFEIIGITCSYGNTDEEHVETNVLRILSLASRNDIPVFGGAKKALIEDIPNVYFFGRDGFGDVEFDIKITATVNKSKHSVIALINMVKQNSGNVSIISLGPSTNLALAIALDNDFTKHVKHFYVMGGSVAGVGNTRPNVEFNFAADPEGNLILFAAAKKAQIILLPWETSLALNLSKKWRKYVLGQYDSPYIHFLNKVETESLVKTPIPLWVTPDSVTAACLLEPSLITSSVVRNVNAVTDGQARGSVLVDYTNSTGRLENTRIIQKVNKKSFVEMLIRYLTCDEIPCDEFQGEE